MNIRVIEAGDRSNGSGTSFRLLAVAPSGLPDR
jgi:hypothetical protein